MALQLKQSFINELIKKARRETLTDNSDEDFNPYNHFGGNMDDAYFGGSEDGETELAREVLTAFGIDWTLNDD